MRICAVVGASDFNDKHFLSHTFDCVVAVDRGYAHLERIGVEPSRVIGDFDSLGYVPNHPYVVQLPVQKDESDIEVALAEVTGQPFDAIYVYGCLGGRIDFTFAVYQLLVRFSQAKPSVYAIGRDFAVCVLSEQTRTKIAFTEQAQGTLSLFAWSEQLGGVCEHGLEYELSGATLRNDSPLGVSNSFIEQPGQISISSGTALLFFSVEALDAVVDK